MTITDAQVSDVMERLSCDLRNTGMASYLYLVGRESANARRLVNDPGRFEEKVVEDVQQDILDGVVVWPPCPHHPNHPLWYHDGAWFCEQKNIRIATIGALQGQRHEPSSGASG
jgi:hypothetical protein